MRHLHAIMDDLEKGIPFRIVRYFCVWMLFVTLAGFTIASLTRQLLVEKSEEITKNENHVRGTGVTKEGNGTKGDRPDIRLGINTSLHEHDPAGYGCDGADHPDQQYPGGEQDKPNRVAIECRCFAGE